MLNRRDVLRSTLAAALPWAGSYRRTVDARIFAHACFWPQEGDAPLFAGLVAIDPSDGSWSRLVTEVGEHGLFEMRVSPDARRFASVRRQFDEDETSLWIGELADGVEPGRIAGGLDQPCWSPDGRDLIASRRDLRAAGGPKVENFRLGIDGASRVPVPIARSDEVVDWSSDGDWLLARGHHASPGPRVTGAMDLVAVRPDGRDRLVVVSGGRNTWARFSPDGRRIAYCHLDDRTVWVVDRDGRNRAKVAGPGNVGECCWSPDGKSLAVVFFTAQQGEFERTIEYRLEQVAVATGEGRAIPLPRATTLSSPNWR